MQARCRSLLLTAVFNMLLAASGSAGEIVIRFSEDDELKTGLRWINLRPDVIRPAAIPTAAVPIGTPPAAASASVGSTAPVDHAEAAVGKLLFLTPGGEAASCTATFVAGNSTLVTAARCIMSREGKQNRDFVFVTAYGSMAQQVYPISCLVLPTAWVREEGGAAWIHNIAFLRTSRTSTFGGLGVTNALPPKEVARVGFSDAVGNGRLMQLTRSGSFMTGDRLVGTVYDPLAAGSSGNPWIRNSIVYSFSSHYDPAFPTVLLGPRFTGATMQLLARAKDDC